MFSGVVYALPLSSSILVRYSLFDGNGNDFGNSFKNDLKKTLKILVLYDHSGPKYHRCLMPALYMPGAEVVVASRITEENLKDTDILFFNRAIARPLGRTVKELCDEWRERYGLKLVVDFDDYWRLGRDHYLHDYYEEADLSSLMEEWISASDAVTVTHERLYYKALALNKNVHILPNSIPKVDQFLFPKTEDEKIRLFWAGSVTHKRDIQLLAGPSRRINSNKVKWVLGGYNKDSEWKAIASYFTGGGKFNNELLESLPVERYYAMYSKCDISLIPLVENTFNTYKSNLKILEAANIGAPVVVSEVHPYLGFPKGVVNYVGRQGEWYDHTKKLIDNPALVKEQGEALKELCDRVYNFEKINKQRKQIFESLCEKKTEPNLKAYVTS